MSYETRILIDEILNILAIIGGVLLIIGALIGRKKVLAWAKKALLIAGSIFALWGGVALCYMYRVFPAGSDPFMERFLQTSSLCGIAGGLLLAFFLSGAHRKQPPNP